MSTSSIVIHGPQGCGKTVNGQRLMRHFGLKQVLDEGMADVGTIPRTGALVLTNDLAMLTVPAGVRVMAFKEAMRLAGFERTQVAAR